MARQYGIILQIILFIAFYAPLIPIIVLYGIIGFGIYYFSVKKNIYRNRCVEDHVSSLLVNEMIEFLEYLLPLFCIASVLFEIFLQPK